MEDKYNIIFTSSEEVKRAKAILESNGFELTEQAQFMSKAIDYYAEEL